MKASCGSRSGSRWSMSWPTAPVRRRRRSASHRATTGPTGASSVTRWAASAKRSTSPPGIRARRSARKRSWNTGSRPPHSRRVGRRCSSSTAAHACNAAYDGSAGVTGMSATKSRTASRRSAVRYGARSAFRCSAAVMWAVPSTNAGVRRQLRSTRRRAAAISGGTATSAGLATAVSASTRPSTSSDPEAPTATGPPQSWAASTRGPSTSWRQKATSSATRSASRRGRPRSDQPIPVWSTATTRHSGARVVSRSRQTYPQEGLPWTQTTVPAGPGPVSSTCQSTGRPSEPGTTTRRDHAGSSPQEDSWSWVGVSGAAAGPPEEVGDGSTATRAARRPRS